MLVHSSSNSKSYEGSKFRFGETPTSRFSRRQRYVIFTYPTANLNTRSRTPCLQPMHVSVDPIFPPYTSGLSFRCSSVKMCDCLQNLGLKWKIHILMIPAPRILFFRTKYFVRVRILATNMFSPSLSRFARGLYDPRDGLCDARHESLSSRRENERKSITNLEFPCEDNERTTQTGRSRGAQDPGWHTTGRQVPHAAASTDTSLEFWEEIRRAF